MRLGSRGVALGTVATLTAALGIAMGSPAQASAAVTASPAQDVFARMSVAQRVGQLLMVGTPATGVSSATATAIASSHVGNVILTGRSTSGVTATRVVTTNLRGRATSSATFGVPLTIATDQEGGQVQVLQGTGFTRMPSALVQGTWSTSTLQSNATTWGQQLASAGINLNLAPVMDTVPSAAFAPQNIPIGHYDREFGYTPSTVASHGSAVVSGMHSAGVATSIKHFPGLGRVTANTDTAAGVTDSQTTSTDPYLQPFAAGVGAGADFLMMSSAIYSKIDASRPAAFSPTIVTGMARQGLGFRGVIISDDLGAATQVSSYPVGARAVNFIAAGGDMVLTVNPSQAATMASSVISTMATNASFRAKVNASVMRVLTVKQRMGLLRPNGAVRSTDVDEDGGPDVIARRTSDRALLLYRGDDMGGLQPTGTGITGNWGFANLMISAGDWDGDRHADVLARRASDGALLLYSGNGRGGMSSGRVIGTHWDTRDRILAMGDISGDSHPDLLATDPTGTLHLYRGNGVGGFGTHSVIGYGWGGIDLMASVGDFDRDGHPDLIARVKGAGTLRLYRSNGLASWRSTVAIPSKGWGVIDTLVGPGDFDGDGLKDLMGRVASTGALVLYPGNGSSGLRSGPVIGTFNGVDLFG